MKKLIVISCYNEELNIEQTLSNLPRRGYDIVMIDNASTDNSVKIAESLSVPVIRHPINPGGSNGVIKTAFLYAFLNDYDIYIHMDGDDQHDPSYLNELLKPIISGLSDVVVGSRFLPSSSKEGFKSLPLRRIGIHIFSWINSKIAGQKITDITSGFRAYNRKAITYFAKEFKHEFESVNQLYLLMAFNGLSIKEIPVMMKPRKHGESEIDIFNAIAFPIKSIISIIGTLLQINWKRRIK